MLFIILKGSYYCHHVNDKASPTFIEIRLAQSNKTKNGSLKPKHKVQPQIVVPSRGFLHLGNLSWIFSLQVTNKIRLHSSTNPIRNQSIYSGWTQRHRRSLMFSFLFFLFSFLFLLFFSHFGKPRGHFKWPTSPKQHSSHFNNEYPALCSLSPLQWTVSANT